MAYRSKNYRGRKKPLEGVVVILDIGSNAEDDQTSSSSFLQKAKDCLIKLIERRIFSVSQDQFSLVLMNSEDLNANEDNEDCDLKNINIVHPLSLVSWDLVRCVDKIGATKLNSASWLEALNTAVDLLTEEQEAKMFTSQKIVMFSRFEGINNYDEAKKIMQKMEAAEIELCVIGHDLEQIQELSQRNTDDLDSVSTQVQKGLNLMSSIVDNLPDAMICSFETTLSKLSYFRGKAVTPAAWKTNLEIGSLIQFEVIGYKMIATLPRISWQAKKVGNSDATLYKDVRNFVPLGKDGEEQEVSVEDIVHSYNYGSTIVPLSSYDKETITYKSGPKSLKLIAFTEKKYVPKHILTGTDVHYFTCGKVERDSAAFGAFFDALEQQNKVGLVRKVYAKDNTPTIGTLYPAKLNEEKVFVFIELPFAEDEIKLKFPSLKDVTPTNEQISAVNKLMDALNLSSPENGGELFDCNETWDPCRQLTYHLLAHKLQHPEETLPSTIPEHISKLLNLPPEIKENAKPTLSEIRQLFPLVEVENNYGEKKTSNVFQQNLEFSDNQNQDGELQIGISAVLQSTVVQVGTVQPDEDFKVMLEKGEDHTEVCNQMKKVIVTLMQRITDSDDSPRIIKAITALRKSCLEKNFQLYNSFLPSLKAIVQERSLFFLWQKIEEEGLGLICNEELEASDVTKVDNKTFLRLDDSEIEMETENRDENIDDLMDEL